jgi:hypothetical protein
MVQPGTLHVKRGSSEIIAIDPRYFKGDLFGGKRNRKITVDGFSWELVVYQINGLQSALATQTAGSLFYCFYLDYYYHYYY